MRYTLVVVLLALAACPPPKPIDRPYPPPSPEELIAAIKKRSQAIQSMRAETKVDHMGNGGQRVKVSVEVLAARGGKLRMEANAPVGGTVAYLTSDGEKFALLDARANRFLTGPAKACNVARLIQIALAPEDIVEALTGGVPLLEGTASVAWDRGGREVLTIAAPDGGREVIKLDARGRTWDVIEADRFDAKNNVLWRLLHEKFEDKGGVRFPERTTVEQPPTGADARIKFKEVELNVKPPDGIFELAPPAGIQPQFTDCP